MSSSSSSPFDSEDESESNMAKYNPFADGRWSLSRVGAETALAELTQADPLRIRGIAMLELDGNELMKVPDMVVTLGTRITELCLNANRLTTLPDFSQLSQRLESLWLHDNQLTIEGLKSGNLSSLTRLSNLPSDIAIETSSLEETQALLKRIMN